VAKCAQLRISSELVATREDKMASSGNQSDIEREPASSLSQLMAQNGAAATNRFISQVLNRFFLLAYLVVLVISSRYWMADHIGPALTTAFALVVYLTYGFIYLLPALLITKLVHYLSRRLGWGVTLTYLSAVLTSGATAVLLIADREIYQLYNFHINGFVINLVTTPGGIESMGISDSGLVMFTLLIFGLFAASALLLWGVHRWALRRPSAAARLKYRYIIIAFLVLSVGERITYGISKFQDKTAVMMVANRFPLYWPTSFRSVMKRLGFKPAAHKSKLLKTEVTRVQYPLHPLSVVPPKKPLNIVWLISESLRADMLTPEIMPATWKLAQQAHRFTHHYSGSNSTRMGVFTQFYGLYGNFWFPFLDSRRGPVLFDVLRGQNYQWRFFTSQKFSYPEFDKTVFANIPASDMQSFLGGAGWERDRKNVTDLLSFLEQRDQKRPFMAYMFFESPHARYYFPPESVIRKPYLEDFNYATMDLKKDMPLIKNRYINSVHHLDSQLARIFDYLKQQGLMENTIVLVTGDHGEEFNEFGHWGHGSSFSDPQTHTPMVLWIPGTGASVEDHMTSHLDVIPTLLPRLGVSNPTSDYALGFDMLGPKQRRYTVTGHWHTLGFIGNDYKAIISMDNAHIGENRVTTADDQPVADPKKFYLAHQSDLVQIMRDIARFTNR
jgi:uncharacterized protein